MKLHEAMALLKEDGSNYIYRENHRIILKDGNYLFERKNSHGWYADKAYGQISDNWQLHQEPKFKVRDLVGSTEKKLYALVKHIESDSRMYLEGIEYNIYHPDDFKLVMKKEELAERMGCKS